MDGGYVAVCVYMRDLHDSLNYNMLIVEVVLKISL